MRHLACQFFAFVCLLAVMTACRESAAPAPAPEAGAPAAQADGATGPTRPPTRREAFGPTIRGLVIETMDASRYTYVLVEAGGERAWAAAPEFDVAVGDEVVFSTSMPMRDHESTTLGRTFEEVYFTGSIQIVGKATAEETMAAVHASAEPIAPAPSGAAALTPPAGGATVASLIANAAELSGEEVVLRGRVVKVTPKVLGRTWLHVQDGSAAGEAGDITVTTEDSATVGDIVLVRGTLATDRDFGSGYSYAVIVEDASVTVE